MAADGAFRLERGEPGTLAVSGTLGFATAAAALKSLDAAVQAGDCIQLDLAAVSSCDSAGLACVLAVLAAASKRGQTVQLQRVPAGLRTLAQVSGVGEMLRAE